MPVMKRNIILAVCMVVAAIVLSAAGFHNQSVKEKKAEDKLNEAMLQVESVKEKHDAVETSFIDMRDKAMQKVMGVNGDVFTEDADMIQKVLKPAYNWTNNQEYDAARATLEKTLPENSAYLKQILVDRKEYNRDGSVYDLNKLGLKCYCEDIQVHPLNVVDGNRLYLVKLDYISYKNDDIEKHDHLTVDRQMLTVTVNEEQQISNIALEQCESIVNYRTVQ